MNEIHFTKMKQAKNFRTEQSDENMIFSLKMIKKAAMLRLSDRIHNNWA